jgi:glyoxylase-like metal-dependent hydrolase (beta-lactamase superfamily II)
MANPEFNLDFAPLRAAGAGRARRAARHRQQSEPFTFHGTNSYIVGDRSVAVIDPGPEDEAHLAALLAALAGREVTHILVSHTHRDHSPLARRLQEATGARIVAEGPHRAARPLHDGETNPFAESADMAFRPDIALGDGETIAGDGWRLTGVHTPGHAANHMAFALEDSGILFSADHVMAGRRRSWRRRMVRWPTTWSRSTN